MIKLVDFVGNIHKETTLLQTTMLFMNADALLILILDCDYHQQHRKLPTSTAVTNIDEAIINYVSLYDLKPEFIARSRFETTTNVFLGFY